MWAWDHMACQVAEIQNEGASKATSAHAKFLVEQRKAETLETRLVETDPWQEGFMSPSESGLKPIHFDF